MQFRAPKSGELERLKAISGKLYDKLEWPEDAEEALVGADEADVPRVLLRAQKAAVLYMALDHDWQTPAMRWAAVERAHGEMMKRLKEKGYTVGYSFFADGVPNGYIRRLVRLGWQRIVDRCVRLTAGGA